jgi:hypothetical protein
MGAKFHQLRFATSTQVAQWPHTNAFVERQIGKLPWNHIILPTTILQSNLYMFMFAYIAAAPSDGRSSKEGPSHRESFCARSVELKAH